MEYELAYIILCTWSLVVMVGLLCIMLWEEFGGRK